MNEAADGAFRYYSEFSTYEQNEELHTRELGVMISLLDGTLELEFEYELTNRRDDVLYHVFFELFARRPMRG